MFVFAQACSLHLKPQRHWSMAKHAKMFCFIFFLLCDLKYLLVYRFDSCECSWSIMGMKFLSVYAVQHKSSLLGQSLTKTRLANTLEACFSMPKEMKLVLIDDSLKDSCRLWAEWNVVLLSKSSTSMPHLKWTFSPFSSMESLPGKFMMWCKVLVFQQCLHPWNWIVCSVARSENSIHAFLHSR